MLERFPDEMEAAAQLTDQANEQALIRQRLAEMARVKAVKAAIDDGDFDGVHCAECDDELPPARVADHRMFCTTCQGARELQQKTRGGR